MRAALVAFVCALSAGHPAAAQNLALTNARIIDGAGGVIDRGTVLVREGRIVSVSQDAAPTGGLPVRDAQGMTVMPGFIDGHRHVIRGDADQWMKEQAPARMREFLEAGFTTILSPGDPVPQILELQRRLRQGDITGPRLLTSGRASTTGTAEEARAAVRAVVKAGVEMIKTTFASTPGGAEAAVLAAIVDEAKKEGVPVIVHVTAVPDMITAVKTGVHRLVHTPHTGTLVATDGARLVAEAKIPMTSTLGVYIPRFDENNMGRITPGGRGATMTTDNLARGAQAPINARLLWDAGVIYGFGTDTSFLPKESLAHELRPLSLFFSARDIVTILTRNAARFLALDAEIGTLEPGKVADMVIVDGDPLADIHNVLNVKVVIKSGSVVVEKR